MPVSKDQVLAALKTVMDPDLQRDLVSLGMIKNIEIKDDGQVAVVVELTTPACPMKSMIRNQVQEAVQKVEGVRSVEATMTSRVQHGRVLEGKASIPKVKNIIAVASGKGGVGKSTTAVNLALALYSAGASVALLDADFYGPNVPGMLGLDQRPEVENERMIPPVSYGIRVMSMGLLIREDQPVIWRGPMLHGALRQLLNDVEWGETDYLVVDLPPGTGDVQLSLVQTVPITGVVIVTTPQKVALQDARKGVMMFIQLNIPILGVLENMAYYLCPKCGHREDIFDSEGGRRVSEEYGVPFLGQIPLVTGIREGMDQGKPILISAPESQWAAAYRQAAERVAQQVSIRDIKS